MLEQDLVINAEVSGEGAGVLREDDVGSISHDLRLAALLGHLRATAQHLHGSRVDCWKQGKRRRQ